VSDGLLFVLLALATARVTRFIVQGDMPLAYYPREWIISLRPDHGMNPAWPASPAERAALAWELYRRRAQER
jgi:hypothetical protein